MSTNRKIIFPMIFILLLAELFPWRAAQANTYEVTNTNDSGHGSLRQAITNANNNPGPDTITFAAATNGTPIFLSGAAGENANASGDLDILDGGNLTIEGNGIGVTIIDGDLNDRVLHVCPGGGCSNSVTLTGLTLRNGRPGIAAGGGILNEGAILTVRNSLIGGVGHGNNAQVGGGLCNNAGTTIVDNTTISANAAFSGGGIYNVAPLFVQNGSLIGGTGAGNQALSADGGGIYNFFGDIVIDASTVSANTAVRDGGGIYNQATLTVQNGSLIGGDGEGNVADYNGGGIYNASGTTTLDASTVSDNLAFYEYGGGIYNEATLNIENGSVIGGTGAGNEAGLYGGGIYDLAGTTTVDGSTVSANRAINGGGIYNGGTLTIRNGSLIGGIGAGNDAWHGGGVLNNTIMTVENSTISANSADDGGGIYNA